MKRFCIAFASLICFTLAGYSQIDTEQWPPNTDFTQEIHFWSADGVLQIPNGSGDLMVENLEILNGGDQGTEDITIAGKAAKKSVSAFMNVKDDLNFVWFDFSEIDILVQYFADQKSVRNNSFLIGTLPASNLRTSPSTYERVTDQFEWRLFRVDNADGKFGDVIDPSIGGSEFGGVNGGTVRFENSTNLIVRAIAIAPSGTFGEPDAINLPPNEIDFNPDDFSNLAVWDSDSNIQDGMDVLVQTAGDQEALFETNVGPASDQRRAVRAAFDNGQDATRDIYLNWEIKDEHFGPTSQPATRVKICASYYDDPALAGETFGPEAYTGPGGAIQFFPGDKRKVLEGSGAWKQAIFFVDDMKFDGVNVAGQAAARFVFTAPVFISGLRLGVFRNSGANEGLDPIPDCSDFDPDPFQIVALWDLQSGVEEGIALGNSGGDQEWFIDGDIGPANDKRTAVRPALGDGADPNFDRYINWAILNEWFGPSSQPNTVFKVCVDYYDDPALAGFQFGPQVYTSERGGVPTFAFISSDRWATLEGTDQWRSHSWVISDMNFTGVNVGPQGAARFQYNDEAPVYISKVQYAVIRNTGQFAGIDSLAGCGENETTVDQWPLH